MYKPADNTQTSFLDFNQPMGLHMNPDNRRIQMADKDDQGTECHTQRLCSITCT